jgi:DNA-binding transcriptional MerR regulator
MDVLLTIGDFSKMTYVSVKALRHYHDVGLLEPVTIDPSSGYRHYAVSQVSTAQAIRRFRDLDMPLEQIRTVLDAPDPESRNEAILAHLRHMQEQLTRTQTSIASLQALLEQTRTVADVMFRTLPPITTLAIEGRVGLADCAAWLDVAFAELHETLDRVGLTAGGPEGGLYPGPFFETDAGDVVAFVPITEPVPSLELVLAGSTGGRAHVVEIGAGDHAVMVHHGPFADLDQTYGALGTVVAERGVGTPGPIREHYFDDLAEVCWPINPNKPIKENP